MCTALQTAYRHERAARDVQFLLLLAVGVDSHFRRGGTDSIDHSAFDVTVAVGIYAVVACRVCAHQSAADSQVTAGIDGVIGRVGINLAAGDRDSCLALYALRS